jgi:hypothetical protein
MKRRLHPAALGAALVLLLSLAFAADALAFSESAFPLPGGLAHDCSAATSLAPGSKSKVDWVIWCGPEKGRFKVELRPAKETAPVTWGASRNVAGAEVGTPRCRPQGVDELCRVRKSGPVTLRGSFRVRGVACAERVDILILAGRWSGEGVGGKPWGCPGSSPPAAPSVSRIVNFYAREHLAPAGVDSRAALARKATRLRQAWIRESPTERWSAQGWGAPVDVATAEELALRIESSEQAAHTIEPWVHAHRLGSIYAGWYWGPEGSIYVGFTREPEANLERLKAAVPFILPDRVKPFPVPPTFSEFELDAWSEKVVDLIGNINEVNFGIVEIGVEVLANKVRVSAEHVAATRELMTERFGPEAPIEVVKGVGNGELL